MRIATLIFINLFLASCDPGNPNSTNRQGDERVVLIESIGHNVILPTLVDLVETSTDLSQQATLFCSDPQMETLRAVKTTWNQTKHVWEQTVTFAYGPYNGLKLEYPSMTQDFPSSKIDSGPLLDESILEIEEKIDDEEPLDISSYNAKVRGLPSIEYLIFFQNEESTLASFREQENSRQCTYLMQTAEDIVQRATDIHRAWDPNQGNFLGVMTFEISSENQPYLTLEDSYAELINRLWISLANVRMDKIQDVLGTKNDEAYLVRAHLVDSKWSNRSFENIRDNLLAIEHFYSGAYGNHQGLGIRALLKDKGSDAGQVFETRLQEAYTVIDAFESSMTEVLLSDPMKLADLNQTLRVLQTSIQTDILTGLSTRRIGNDADGD